MSQETPIPDPSPISDSYFDIPRALTRQTAASDQHEVFYRQAYCLGKCAELVYPPPSKETLPVDDLAERWNEFSWADFLNREKPSDPDASTDMQDWKSATKDAQSPEWLNWLKTHIDPENEIDDPEKIADIENDIDAIADKLYSSYSRCWRARYLYLIPPWWFAATKGVKRNVALEQAKRKWEVAHQLWAEKARNRIDGAVKKAWHANEGEVNVKFDSKNGIEYFVAGDAETIILCFRGTEVNKFGDILADLALWQIEEPGGKNDGKGAARFHEGFWNALDGVWDQLTKEVKDIQEKKVQDQDQKVWITGHSLGGALATLAAYRLVRSGTLKPDQIGGVFTFGQPRVGDKKFVEQYRGFKDGEAPSPCLDDRHFRFVNNNDVVTTVPPKSLWWASVVSGLALDLVSPAKPDKALTAPAKEPPLESAGSETPKPNAKRKRTFEYGDVGRVVLANRAGGIKLLTPDWSLRSCWKLWSPAFWWPVLHWSGYCGSWLKAPFMPFGFGGLKERFLPGVGDHSMQDYNRLLNAQCEHYAFVDEAVQKMKETSAQNSADPTKQDRALLKAAEKAWAGLRSKADKAAWAKRKQELAAKTPPDLVRQAGEDAWSDAVKRERPKAIEKAVADQQSAT